MKKLVIKILNAGLNMFESVIVSHLSSESVKQFVKLLFERLGLFGDALVDADPNNKAQIEKIAKETLISPLFQQMETSIAGELAAKIPNEKLREVLMTTDKLRLQFLGTLGDNDPNNQEQIKQLFDDFLKSEEFDTIVLTLTKLLTDKYSKNETVSQVILGIVTELVNSDDNPA